MTAAVAIYARLSPRPDGTYEGVDAQERAGRAYAERTWPGQPVEVFADKGISAANGDHRPGYEALRDAIRARRITHLWAVEQSRLERREAEWFTLAAELDAAGIAEVHTARDGIIRVRDEVAGIKAVLAAGEVRRIKARVNAKLADNAGLGYPPPVTPFGYRRWRTVDGQRVPIVNAKGEPTFEVDERQAAAVRWAADKILSGWSLSRVAAALRDRGVVGRSGGLVTATTVRTWLQAPTIAGKRVHRGAIIGDGNWPPLLDEATWQAVRTTLGAPRTVTTAGGERRVTAGHLRAKPGRRYLLTGGLAVCGVCGGKMAGSVRKLGPRSTSKVPFLSCKFGAHVGAVLDPVERHVLDALWAELDRPDFLDAVAADDDAAERDRITDALGDLDRRRAELAAMWGSGDLGAQEWSAARGAIDEREEALRADLAALGASPADVDIAGARQAWDAMTLDERRQFVRLFVESVVVKPAGGVKGTPTADRVDIVWRTL